MSRWLRHTQRPLTAAEATHPSASVPWAVRMLRGLCCGLVVLVGVGMAGVFGRGFQSSRRAPMTPVVDEPSAPDRSADEQDSVLSVLAVPPGAVALGGLGQLPGGADRALRSDSPPALLGWNCPQSPSVAAEWVREQMQTRGWRESQVPPTSLGDRVPGQQLAIFDRTGQRAWLRIEPRPGGGCRLFWMRLSVEAPTPVRTP